MIRLKALWLEVCRVKEELEEVWVQGLPGWMLMGDSQASFMSPGTSDACECEPITSS